ncbi:MAG: hypothetical protein JJU21_17965 [Salinarimonas sp.]|nr:hypothetical protein [Salinarimonas sp.]
MNRLELPDGKGFSLRKVLAKGGLIDAFCGLLVIAAVTSSLLVIVSF